MDLGSADKAKSAIDELVEKIQEGATAKAAATQYMNDYLWARLWQIITTIANLPASENGTTLIDLKAQLKAYMLIAQEMKMDIANAELAVQQLRKAYEVKAQYHPK